MPNPPPPLCQQPEQRPSIQWLLEGAPGLSAGALAASAVLAYIHMCTAVHSKVGGASDQS
jgi:hypothetical protein